MFLNPNNISGSDFNIEAQDNDDDFNDQRFMQNFNDERQQYRGSQMVTRHTFTYKQLDQAIKVNQSVDVLKGVIKGN